jgi:hypothetical protein
MPDFGRVVRRLSGSHPSERPLGDDVILLAPAHTYSGLGAGQPANDEAGRAFVGPALPRAPPAWCPLGGWGPFFPKAKEGDPKAALKLHRVYRLTTARNAPDNSVNPPQGTRAGPLQSPAPYRGSASSLAGLSPQWLARRDPLGCSRTLCPPASWAAFLAATYFCVHA